MTEAEIQQLFEVVDPQLEKIAKELEYKTGERTVIIVASVDENDEEHSARTGLIASREGEMKRLAMNALTHGVMDTLIGAFQDDDEPDWKKGKKKTCN